VKNVLFLPYTAQTKKVDLRTSRIRMESLTTGLTICLQKCLHRVKKNGEVYLVKNALCSPIHVNFNISRALESSGAYGSDFSSPNSLPASLGSLVSWGHRHMHQNSQEPWKYKVDF
jgi:hypothetical protein